MSAAAQLAYGNARVRARKSRLLSSAVLVALASAEHPELTIDGWRDVDADADATPLVWLVYARLIADYDAVIRAYPAHTTLLHALVRRHELENVKLACRVVVSGADPDRWLRLWRPMGRLETVSRDGCASASSLPQLTAALGRTPFADIAGVVLRVHAADLSAAELAFDRWGSRMLAEAADALPPHEDAARDLVCGVVCERDAAVIERAIGPLGVAPQAAIRMASMLGRALGAAGARVLTEWSSGGGAPLTLPRRLSAERPVVRSFAELRRAIHAGRREACRRVFAGHPFSAAPAVALVLLREDEARALISIGELRARHASVADSARVLDLDG